MTTFLPVNMDHPRAEIEMNFQKISTAPFMPRTERPVKREAQEQTQVLNTSGHQSENKRQAVDGSPNGHVKSSYSHAHPMSNRNGSREGSSTQSSAPEDAPNHESDGEHYGSENEGDAGDTAPPSKKKKGQRFYCKDFPPCNLSFTRSEHLARHIRKHTGERPFQCHCSRRFSRLDNLRQHAQTVHVNEDIPGDSLAATGTRFQRQIRTDRVRPPGRARAGTGGSQGGHSRGHSRNLSTSSIASTVSSYSQSQELRRRPQPLMMANDGASRARLSLETVTSTPKTPPQQIHPFSAQSPNTALFTPSTVYGDTASPFYASPASAGGFWGDSIHNRRLSVPSGSRPFSSSHASSYPPNHLRQLAPASSGYPGNDSPLGGPSIPHTPHDAQGTPSSDSDWRRRTWHPSTAFARPATSGLWYQESAELAQPGYPPALQSVPSQNAPRLPGIESFDQLQNITSAPPRREPTPMQIDRPSETEQPSQQQTPTAPSFPGNFNLQNPVSRLQPPVSGPGHRRGYHSVDMSLYRNLNRLDIGGNDSQKQNTPWGQQAPRRQLAPTQDLVSAGTTMPTVTAQAMESPESQRVTEPMHRNKRHAWYNDSIAHRPAVTSAPSESTILENTQVTPKASVDYLATVATNESEAERRRSFAAAEFGPNISKPIFDGNPEPRSGRFSGPTGADNGLNRLEALVAVATSESSGRMI